MRVGPCDCAVSVLFRVVAVPGWCSVIAFCGIVITFTMAAHVQELVLRVARRLMVQFGELVLESLPLGRIVNVKCLVAGIGAVEEPEIGGHEVERCGSGARFILKEIAVDGGVVVVTWGVRIGSIDHSDV